MTHQVQSPDIDKYPRQVLFITSPVLAVLFLTRSTAFYRPDSVCATFRKL